MDMGRGWWGGRVGSGVWGGLGRWVGIGVGVT